VSTWHLDMFLARESITLSMPLDRPLNFYAFPDLASRRTWSEITGLSERSLIRAESHGLKAHRPDGRKVLYSKQAVIAYLLGQRHPVTK
jgi:hypothetical protein